MDRAGAIEEQSRSRLRSEIFGMLIALAFCAFGGFFYYAHLAGNGDVVDTVFVWTLRVGAVGFAICASLAFGGQRVALIADAVLCSALTLILIVTAVAWLAESVYVEGFLLGIAGALAGRAAVRSWHEFTAWRDAAAESGPTPLTIVEHRPESVQPTPSGVPLPPPGPSGPERQPSEPPPEGGYLAELGREDD